MFSCVDVARGGGKSQFTPLTDDWDLLAARAAGVVRDDDAAARDLDLLHKPRRSPSVSPILALAAALPASVAAMEDVAPALTVAASQTAAISPALSAFLSVFPPLCFGFLQVSGYV